MIQLSFQPALDPFHAMFRFLRLRKIAHEVGKLPVDHFRILDFYLAFPFRIQDLRVKPEHRRLKTAVIKAAWPIPYGDQPDDKVVLSRMEPFQGVALQTLASHAVIDGPQLDRGIVQFADAAVPPALATRVDGANEQEGTLVDLLVALANDYELMGVGGLKERSGLLEHRYDTV